MSSILLFGEVWTRAAELGQVSEFRSWLTSREVTEPYSPAAEHGVRGFKIKFPISLFEAAFTFIFVCIQEEKFENVPRGQTELSPTQKISNTQTSLLVCAKE